jgi:methylisocitrate lyase
VEDQPFPKRCGHMEKKRVVSVAEMVAKIEAIIETRRSELVVIARTDARATDGVSEAIRRGNHYAEVGADLIFPEAPESAMELERFAREIHAPLVANMTEWGKTPLLSSAELQQMGFKIVLFPVSSLRVSFRAVWDFLNDLMRTGTQEHYLKHMKTRQELYELVGYPQFEELESRFVLD